MEKLDQNVVILLSDEFKEIAQKELKEECEGIPDQLTIEIYYIEDIVKDNMDWEVYHIKVIEISDEFGISINKLIMDIGREMVKIGDTILEEFIYEIVMTTISETTKKEEIRDFFEDISD